MPVYELGFISTNASASAPDFEIVAGSGTPMRILEFTVTVNNVTHRGPLGRPGNTPAGGTPVTATTPIGLDESAGASAGGVILSGWSTPPTSTTANREVRTTHTQSGTGAPHAFLFSWEDGGLVVGAASRAESLSFFRDAGTTTPAFYLKWVE